MLLGWPDVELVGVTTTIDPGGKRAGYVHRCLELAGRDGDVPVAAGAEVSMTTLVTPGDIPEDERFWPDPVQPRPSSAGAALDLLTAAVDSGASIVAIGPYTNLGVLEVVRPGSLGQVPVVLMGGWIDPPDNGLPQWGPGMDWNVQCDTRAAEIVAKAADDLTLVTLAATFKAPLRRADLPRLSAAGPLGELLARQAVAHGAQYRMAELGKAHAGLPDDLLNFHYDPVACAVAAGWQGVTVEEMRLRTSYEADVLRFVRADDGRSVRVVTGVDGAAFTSAWLEAVSAV
jgi:inosine-uridine nucleoside N-ribohydrolase